MLACRSSVITHDTWYTSFIIAHLPEDDNSYWDTMTGTNSSNDRLVIASNCGNTYDVFGGGGGGGGGGMKSSTMWIGNAKKNAFEWQVISTIYYGL